MRRWWIVLTLVALSTTALVVIGYLSLNRLVPPIRVGLLHSRTGPMAISERPMLDAEVLAIEELNAKGGLLGRRIEVVSADGKSDPRTFADEARRLIEVEKVSVIIGCWTSACRRSVIPVVESSDHLLIYPVAYEGLENSPQVFHIGASPNQQIIPTVSFATRELGAKSFFLVGDSSIWSHTLNEIVKDQLHTLRGESLGELYPGSSRKKQDEAIEAILKAKPDVILNSLEGESNLHFFQKLKEKGLDREKTKVISFAINEDEVKALSSIDLAGTYSVGSYFQSLDRPENLSFLERFQKRFGKERVTSDAISSAYMSVMLWSQAVIDAETEEASSVRAFLPLQSYNAPEGIVSIDRDNFHTWRSFFVGKIQSNGRIEIVSVLNKPIRPVPYPLFRSSDSWEGFLRNLHEAWGGRWVAPEQVVSENVP